MRWGSRSDRRSKLAVTPNWLASYHINQALVGFLFIWNQDSPTKRWHGPKNKTKGLALTHPLTRPSIRRGVGR